MVKNVLKVLSITVIAVILRIACTAIFGGDPISITEPFGNIAGILGIIPSVIILFFISYLHLTIIGFSLLKGTVSSNIKNGFLYGLLFGVLWLFGMFEAGIIKGIAQRKELIFGISEALPIIVLGLLIPLFSNRKQISNTTKHNSYFEYIVIILIFTISYSCIRYLGYVFIGIESKYLEKLIETLLWTIGNGVIISTLYIFCRKELSLQKKHHAALYFGVLIFGIDWIIYNMFVPVFFNVSLFITLNSFLLRSILDILSIVFSIIITEKYILKKRA
jgi:hypothetical protein